MAKKALIFYGDWEGHEPEKTAQRFAGILDKHCYKVDLRQCLDTLEHPHLMSEYDLIVPVYKQGSVAPEGGKSLLQAIKAGAGLAGWHGGMADAFRTSTEYQFACGGQWVAHPGNIINRDDPITKGLSDFPICTQSSTSCTSIRPTRF